jgi:hypothetical protein
MALRGARRLLALSSRTTFGLQFQVCLLRHILGLSLISARRKLGCRFVARRPTAAVTSQSNSSWFLGVSSSQAGCAGMGMTPAY